MKEMKAAQLQDPKQRVDQFDTALFGHIGFAISNAVRSWWYGLTSSKIGAALAPKLAAELYGLDVLRSELVDEPHNTTRFIILSRDDLRAAPGIGPVMTTFVFNVRNVPAALYKALGGFATNQVNMTRLESYMIGGQFIATQFLADVEGHPDERGLAIALEELGFFADYRILGVYRQSPFRERVKDIAAARPQAKG